MRPGQFRFHLCLQIVTRPFCRPSAGRRAANRRVSFPRAPRFATSSLRPQKADTGKSSRQPPRWPPPYSPPNRRSTADLVKLGEVCEWFQCDNQGRGGHDTPIWGCALQGRVCHAVQKGKMATKVTAAWSTGTPRWRNVYKSQQEEQMWFDETLASGMVPYHHIIGGADGMGEDRRWLEPARKYFDWMARHDAHFVNRRSVANLGVVMGQRTHLFYQPPRGSLMREYMEGICKYPIIISILRILHCREYQEYHDSRPYWLTTAHQSADAKRPRRHVCRRRGFRRTRGVRLLGGAHGLEQVVGVHGQQGGGDAGGGIDHGPEPIQPVLVRYGHRLYAGDRSEERRVGKER